MQQALAAFVGSGAVCYFVFDEPISSFLTAAGPLGFGVGQLAGSSDFAQTIIAGLLALDGDFGDTFDIIFSNGLLSGGLFVKIFGGRDFKQTMYMTGGALVAMGIAQYISTKDDKKQ